MRKLRLNELRKPPPPTPPTHTRKYGWIENFFVNHMLYTEAKIRKVRNNVCQNRFLKTTKNTLVLVYFISVQCFIYEV